MPRGREERRSCRAAPSAAERRGARVTLLQRSGGRRSRRLGERPARGAADRPVAGRGGVSAVRARCFERPGPCGAVAAMAAPPDFHLPLAPADLLRDGGPGRYVVQEVLPAGELPPALAGKVFPHPLPGRARSCRRLTAIPPASLRVLPQLSGPPSVRGARWPCWSTSTACTACCSEYGAGTGRRGGRSPLWQALFARRPYALCLSRSHFRTVGTAVKEDALELMMHGGYPLFPAGAGLAERLFSFGSTMMI